MGHWAPRARAAPRSEGRSVSEPAGQSRQVAAVRVPATTANLGPGFDALGAALGLYNRLHLALAPDLPPGAAVVAVHGEGAGLLPGGPENLAHQAIARLHRAAGVPLPGLRLTLDNAIPVSRGLGSSSSAIVGGLVGANALLGGPLDREALLRLAVEMEGHPDNVTPALLGGIQVVAPTETGALHVSLPLPAGVRAVVCIPATPVATGAARRALPDAYPRTEAVFNVGRVALLVAALAAGRTDLLRAAMQDRLHQPYRAPLVPGFTAAVAAALDAGALGACLSGSGSTILALASGHETAIGAAMTAAVQAAGGEARALTLELASEGATVERLA